MKDNKFSSASSGTRTESYNHMIQAQAVHEMIMPSRFRDKPCPICNDIPSDVFTYSTQNEHGNEALVHNAEHIFPDCRSTNRIGFKHGESGECHSISEAAMKAIEQTQKCEVMSMLKDCPKCGQAMAQARVTVRNAPLILRNTLPFPVQITEDARTVYMFLHTGERSTAGYSLSGDLGFCAASRYELKLLDPVKKSAALEANLSLPAPAS